MASNTVNIPGFYFDEKTNRYYKETPGGAEDPTLKKIKAEAFHGAKASRKSPETWNLLKHLSERQLVSLTVTKDVKLFYRRKIGFKSLIKENSFNASNSQDIANVELVKGGPETICGVWTNKKNGYALGQISYEDSEVQSIGFKSFQRNVVDICDGLCGTVVYVYNSLTGCTSGFQLMSWKSNGAFTTYAHFHSTSMPMYCCSNAEFDSSLYLAIGSENLVNIYNGVAPTGKFRCKGRVHSVVFSDTGHYIISGLHNGTLVVHDRRSAPTPEAVIKLSKYALTDLLFLPPEQVIVTGLSNNMYQLDLRTHKVTTDFLGHVHSMRKSPITKVGELVCVSGADNIIRIWDSLGGLPVFELKPNNPEIKQRGFLSTERDNSSKTFLYLFEEDKMRLYDLDIPTMKN